MNNNIFAELAAGSIRPLEEVSVVVDKRKLNSRKQLILDQKNPSKVICEGIIISVKFEPDDDVENNLVWKAEVFVNYPGYLFTTIVNPDEVFRTVDIAKELTGHKYVMEENV